MLTRSALATFLAWASSGLPDSKMRASGDEAGALEEVLLPDLEPLAADVNLPRG